MRGCTLALAALVGSAAVAFAQSTDPNFGRSPSHVDIAPVDPRDPARIVADRLKQLKSQRDLLALLEPARSASGAFDFARYQRLMQDQPELFERAREMLRGIDLGDPRLRGMIQEILRQNNWHIDPELVLQQLENLKRDGSGGGVAQAMLIPKGSRRDGAAGTGGADSSEADRAWTREIVDWVNRLPKDRLASSLRDSPAIKDLLRDLTRSGAFGPLPAGDTLDAQLSRWRKRWESARSWLPEQWPDSLRVNLSGLTSAEVNLPRIQLGGISRDAASMPVLGTIADLLPALYVLLAALMALAAFRLLRARLLTRRRQAAAEATAGPSKPARIESRAEVIQAFDYLAVARCGPSARSWHHRAVAQRLPRDEAERSAAAALAAAYEWARYAPDRGEAPADLLADVRRNLRQIEEAPA